MLEFSGDLGKKRNICVCVYLYICMCTSVCVCLRRLNQHQCTRENHSSLIIFLGLKKEKNQFHSFLPGSTNNHNDDAFTLRLVKCIHIDNINTHTYGKPLLRTYHVLILTGPLSHLILLNSLRISMTRLSLCSFLCWGSGCSKAV